MMSQLPLLAEVTLATESDTLALGRRLGHIARVGDVFALRGPLGAGKTTLARGFITARTGIDEDIVSPTFTLVQIYDEESFPIWHFDLYRLNQPTDVLELGWEDAVSGGICVVEWPERLGPLLPAARLDVALSMEPGETPRKACLHGNEVWKERIAAMTHD